jgi:hypothetical protein|tara:strand:+ start:473 stop:667 length:195 start_codon:yes stop_codon:yes gene_type:complete
MTIENKMKIENAKYIKSIPGGIDRTIDCWINDVHSCVPMVDGNREYEEIKKQLAAGTLTIEASD